MTLQPVRSVVQYLVDDDQGNSRVEIQLIEGRTPEQLAEDFRHELARAAQIKFFTFCFLDGQYDTVDYYTSNFYRPRKVSPRYPIFTTLDDYFEEYKTVL